MESEASIKAVKFVAIVAMDESRVIGVQGGLPWRIPEDMKRFSALTKGHTVLMGRKTYESLPAKFRPLPDRQNIVISGSLSSDSLPTEVRLCASLEKCIEDLRKGEIAVLGGSVWIIGGEQIYRQTSALWDEVYVTRVTGSHPGDAFFPRFEEGFELVEDLPHDGYSFQHYIRG